MDGVCSQTASCVWCQLLYHNFRHQLLNFRNAIDRGRTPFTLPCSLSLRHLDTSSTPCLGVRHKCLGFAGEQGKPRDYKRPCQPGLGCACAGGGGLVRSLVLAGMC